jgi:hypothetical protein
MEAMSQRVTQHTPRQALGETAVSMDATDKMDANDVMDAMNAAEGLGHAISEDDKDQHVHSTTPHRTQNSSKLQLGSRKDLEELRSLKRRKRLQGTRGKGSQVRSPRRGKRTGVAMAAAFQGFVVDWDTVVRGWSERGAVQLQEVLGQIADGYRHHYRSLASCHCPSAPLLLLALILPSLLGRRRPRVTGMVHRSAATGCCKPNGALQTFHSRRNFRLQ